MCNRGISHLALMAGAFGFVAGAPLTVSSLNAQEPARPLAKPTTSVEQPVQEPAAPVRKWTPQAGLGFQVDTDGDSTGEIDLIVPVAQDDKNLFFFDLRGALASDDVEDGNFGFGYRRMVTEGRAQGYNFGVYGFYDTRSTSEDNRFDQVTIGAEALGRDFDFRVNTYLPLEDDKDAPGASRLTTSGGNLQLTEGQEVSFTGVDGEVGWRLPINPVESNRQLRLFLGGFHFESDEDQVDDISGVKARAEYQVYDFSTVGSRISAFAELRSDELNDEDALFGLRVRYPFAGFRGKDGPELNWQERRMLDPIERQRGVVTETGAFGPSEDVRNSVTGVAITSLSVVDANDAGAPGDLDAILTAAGPGALVVIQGDAGIVEGGATLAAGQTVLGGGSNLVVQGVNSGARATYSAPGSRPTVDNDVDAAVLEIADDTYVAGLDITGAGSGTFFASNDGILAPAVTNAFVLDNNISGFGHDGIRFEGAAGGPQGNVTIQNNVVTDIGEDGIQIIDGYDGVTITGNSVSGTANGLGNGIIVGEDNDNVVISDNTIDAIDDDGIRVGPSSLAVAVRNNTITNIGDNGINIFSSNTSVTVDGNTIETVGVDGIHVGDDNATLIITNNVITLAGDDGIRIGSDNGAVGGVQVGTNSITDVTSAALNIFANNVIDISDNTIAGGFGSVLTIGDPAPGVQPANTLSGTGNVAGGAPAGDYVDRDAVVGSAEFDGVARP